MSKQLLKKTSTVSFMTLLSRILGFLRDVICAQYFGASLGFDAFLLAFKIPNFWRRLFAEGAFSQAFVPILSEYKTTRNEEEIQALIERVAGNLTLVLTGVTALGILAAPVFIYLFAPGFSTDGVRFTLASEMLRITFPYLLFISLTALAGGILNTYQKFALPAFTPVLLNISMIVFALFIGPYFQEPVMALAWGVFFGGVLQLGLQWPFLKRLGFAIRLKIDWKDKGVKRILKLMLPAVLGASVMQINLLVGTLFASFLPVGSLSWLYYSDRLLELPLGMIGVALATVSLPNLSQNYASKNVAGFRAHLQWSLKWCVLIGLPASLGLWILSGPILATLFYRGAFGSHDVMMAQKSLEMLSLGLIAFMSTKVLVSAFYAQQNTKFPVKVAMISLVCGILLNFALMGPFAHAGLALSSTLAVFLQMIILLVALNRQGTVLVTGWGHFLLKIGAANMIMAFSLYTAAPELGSWLDWSSWKRASMLFALMGFSLSVYLATLWAFGLRVRHVLSENA